MLKHINTHSKAELTDMKLSQEQKHGQQYLFYIRPHKLFTVKIYRVTKRFCHAQTKSPMGFQSKKNTNHNKQITRYFYATPPTVHILRWSSKSFT